MRIPAGAMLLVSLLVAGCFSTPDVQPPGPTDAAADAVPEFLDPVAVAPTGPQQGEFFIATTPDGETLLTCTHGEFVAPAPKYVSRDRGATWTSIQPSPPTGVAGDCWVDIGDDGAWYFIDSQVEGNTVSSTTDEGASWTVNQLATPPVTGTADRPYMVPLGGASMGLSYIGQYLAPGTVAFVRTDDHGVTWTTPVTVSEIQDDKTNIMHGPMIVNAARDTIRIPLFRFAATDFPSGGPAHSTFFFAVSRDGGATWNHETVLEQVDTLFTPPAVGWAGDTIYWAYEVGEGAGQFIELITSPDNGATWGEPVRVAGPWDYIGYMWMDVAPDGTALLSVDAEAGVVDSTKSGEHLLLFKFDARREDPLVWAAAVAPSANNEFSTVTHDPQGRIVAAYRNDGQWLVLRQALS